MSADEPLRSLRIVFSMSSRMVFPFVGRRNQAAVGRRLLCWLSAQIRRWKSG